MEKVALYFEHHWMQRKPSSKSYSRKIIMLYLNILEFKEKVRYNYIKESIGRVMYKVRWLTREVTERHASCMVRHYSTDVRKMLWFCEG